MKRTLFVVLSLSALMLCLQGGITPTAAQSSALTAIATNTILADVATQVAGGLITVVSLLPPNTDPHAYQPTADDAVRITGAQLVLADGAGYEQFLAGLIQSVGEGIPVVIASESVGILRVGEHDPNSGAWIPETLGLLGDGVTCAGDPPLVGITTENATPEARVTASGEPSTECDPHVWMNPLNVIVWAENIAQAFGEIDPANAETYRANAADYAAQLEALDLDIQEMVAEVLPERRVLVTTHEFMGYFANQYGFQIAATVLPGASSGAETDPQRLAELITFVRDQQVPAIFMEVSGNREMAQLVANEAGVAVVTSVYAESLSAPDGNAPTYIDLMLANARTIANALR